jgi:Holliday junction DNA helicase RuvB
LAKSSKLNSGDKQTASGKLSPSSKTKSYTRDYSSSVEHDSQTNASVARNRAAHGSRVDDGVDDGPLFPESDDSNDSNLGAGAERLVETVALDGDLAWENTLRPKIFEDFPGQERVKDKLKVFVQAATARGEPLDHILLSGPPGLGKTTLATIIANTMGVEIKTTSAPALERKGDLAAILTSLKANSILFIDEIHRLNRTIEEYLYSAMEDFYLDIVTGDGLGARTMKFQLAPFTLIGATTRAGLLNAPLRDRFGIVERLSFYDKSALALILTRSARLLNTAMTEEGAQEMAKRSRGTPRIANRLLKRVRDYAQVKGDGTVTAELAHYALDQLEVDHLGLDDMDRRILILIHDKFGGGPVGIETLSAALSEDKGTLEEVYEPFLIQEGLLLKTPRGRMVTDLAKAHLGYKTNDRLGLGGVTSSSGASGVAGSAAGAELATPVQLTLK